MPGRVNGLAEDACCHNFDKAAISATAAADDPPRALRGGDWDSIWTWTFLALKYKGSPVDGKFHTFKSSGRDFYAAVVMGQKTNPGSESHSDVKRAGG